MLCYYEYLYIGQINILLMFVPPNPTPYNTPPSQHSLYPKWDQSFMTKIRKGFKNLLEMLLRWVMLPTILLLIHSHFFFIRYRIVALDSNVMAFSDQAFHEEPVIIFTNPQHARFPAPQKVTSTHIRYIKSNALWICLFPVWINLDPPRVPLLWLLHGPSK